MFSALGKVFSYVLHGSDSPPSQVVSPSLQDEDQAAPIQGCRYRTVEGKVTHLFDSHGLINGEMYFSFDDVIGGCRPVLGSRVDVKASQAYEGGGWHAERVTLVESVWEEGGGEEEASYGGGEGDSVLQSRTETGVKTEVVGIVTHLEGSQGYINDNVVFSCEDTVDYTPARGDWVQAAVRPSDLDPAFSVAHSLAPVRTTETEGVVSAFQGNHGYIDGEIFFSSDVLQDGYEPRKWDPVQYKAVESQQGKCNWRAIQVTPVTKTHPDRLPVLRGPLQKSFVAELQADKQGICVTQETDFNQVQLGEKKQLTVWVQNTGIEPKTFCSCRMTAENSQLTVDRVCLMKDSAATPTSSEVQGKITLYPSMSLYVTIGLNARCPGYVKQMLVFKFEELTIGRYITGTVLDAMQGLVQCDQPYANKRSQAFTRYKDTASDLSIPSLVPGRRPNRFKKVVQFPDRLPQYLIPESLRDDVLNGEDLQHCTPVLSQNLSFANYTERFKVLLHLEEIQMDIDIREFDLYRVCLRRVGELMGLGVPGLAEGRPSVLIGDKVVLTEPGDTGGPCYEGYVHEILKDEVLLKFHPEFHRTYVGKDYDVVFTFNRGALRKCHRAVELAVQLGENVLFPKTLEVRPAQCGSQASATRRVAGRQGEDRQPHPAPAFFNTTLNACQRSAVTRIRQGQGRPLPYILFGPPGTGKTVTVVEAILQVLTYLPSSRIIACAPSNSAADLLTERLHDSGQLKNSHLVRLNAMQRSEESIPDSIRQYCSVGDNLRLASRYRIVVSTCVSAGVLYTLGIKPGHFTHCFIDEAGQATEPESLISACLVMGASGQIVLAGDPRQLGPVLQSSLARRHGLDVSLLERLMELPLYCRDEARFADHGAYDPLLVTKLVDNYRSHAALLKVPSQLFYHDELIVQADTRLTHTFCDWGDLPSSGLPCIFHGVRGEDMREGNSPSWFNPGEVYQTVRYLQSILSTRRASREDIGVITPYRKQVEKIRLLMVKLGMEMVKVGSVEEFQGQERQVIIISTVRSNDQMIGEDVRHSLGFLSNPKRFNVSITRAQALLIVIGNPHVLYQDQNWKALIDYCIDVGAYTGCDAPQR